MKSKWIFSYDKLTFEDEINGKLTIKKVDSHFFVFCDILTKKKSVSVKVSVMKLIASDL